MTIAEILLQDYDIEISNTRRTLERVPEGKNDWKCHDKSMPLGKLAMHCATITTLRLLHPRRRRHGHGQLQTPTQSHSIFTTRENALTQLDETSAKVPRRPRRRLRRASLRTLALQLRRARHLQQLRARSPSARCASTTSSTTPRS